MEVKTGVIASTMPEVGSGADVLQIAGITDNVIVSDIPEGQFPMVVINNQAEITTMLFNSLKEYGKYQGDNENRICVSRLDPRTNKAIPISSIPGEFLEVFDSFLQGLDITIFDSRDTIIDKQYLMAYAI